MNLELQSVKKLEILPLIDWHTNSPEQSGEAGVSYLIRTDGHTILFDVGFNRKKEHPSPLLRNMKALGVRLDEIDKIVISHNHLDHVGGSQPSRVKTIRLSTRPTPDFKTKVYVPEEMHHSRHEMIKVEHSMQIAPGVAILSPLPRKLWLLGPVLEQSLAIRVDGLGIVLIVGCGHPGIEAILKHSQKELGQSAYAVVGGLHFPVGGSRFHVAGIPVQKYLGIGEKPFPTLTIEDVSEAAALCKSHGLKKLQVSGHDSTDNALDEFERVFGEGFEIVRVGQTIVHESTNRL